MVRTGREAFQRELARLGALIDSGGCACFETKKRTFSSRTSNDSVRRPCSSDENASKRKRVEAQLEELKNQIGLRRLRRLKFVREQFFLAAAAQNIKRFVQFLSQATIPTVAVTT